MAHFAELDENNVVLRVIVVDNKDTQDENGNEVEAIGAEFCNNLLGGRWVQTSYNSNFRKRYAAVNGTYDEVKDVFIHPQPFPSWILNPDTTKWEAPTPMPNDGKPYEWDESTLSWVEITVG